jgi:hypothetical protein
MRIQKESNIDSVNHKITKMKRKKKEYTVFEITRNNSNNKITRNRTCLSILTLNAIVLTL